MRPVNLFLAEPADWKRAQELHAEQCATWGTDYELPYLWGPNIIVALKAVDSDGLIRTIIYVERTAEMRFVGCDPKGTAYSRREIDGLSYIVKQQGIKWLECFVPRIPLRRHWWEFWKRKNLVGMISKPLIKAGFKATEETLAHFTRDLRGSQNHE